MKKYIALKSRQDENIIKRHEWFQECRNEQVPYIVITKKRKYAKITLDYDGYKYDSYEYEKIYKLLNSNSELIISNFIEIFKRFCLKKSSYYGNVMYFEFRNMPIHTSEEVAEAVYDFINSLVIDSHISI